MKKRILNLIVALVLVSVSLFASNTPSISTIDSKSLILDTKIWKSALISVVIKDDEGAVIFEDSYSTQKGKRFSFENFANGKYSIVLSDDFKSTEQFFMLNAGGLVILPKTVTVFKPVIIVKESYIDLNYLAPSNNTTVTIYDENNSVFNFKIEDKKDINKRFDTSTLPKGTYTFNVSSNIYSYSRTFQK